MAEETFRVRVSLERFFKDERARCFVSVRGGRRVRWLARRLRRLFLLPRRLALLSHGHLLPPDEPLSLLCPDDPVEVIEATVKVAQTDEDDEVVSSEDTVDATSEPLESSPVSQKSKRSKNHDCNLPSAPLTVPDNFVYNNGGTETAKEAMVSKLTLTNTKSNKIYFYDSNLDIVSDKNIALCADTENIQDEVELQAELSDSERIRILKEQALAALDEVEARPKRRVRVRRRRKRPAEPVTEVVSNISDYTTERLRQTVGLALECPLVKSTDRLSWPKSIPATASEIVEREEMETVEKLPQIDGSEDIPDASIQVLKTSNCRLKNQTIVSERPAVVLRNMSAGARAARLVHSLVDFAPV